MFINIHCNIMNIWFILQSFAAKNVNFFSLLICVLSMINIRHNLYVKLHPLHSHYFDSIPKIPNSFTNLPILTVESLNAYRLVIEGVSPPYFSPRLVFEISYFCGSFWREQPFTVVIVEWLRACNFYSS